MTETEVLNLIVVYAAPTVTRRSGLWEKLKNVVQNSEGPVVIGGDFNTIVRVDERTGGNGRLSPDSLAFGEWINDLSLIDMGFRGNQFTWERGRSENSFVAKRLDRVLCCAHARLKWQDALDQHQSDELLNKEEVLLKEFDVVLEQEEMVWFQKSREKWKVDGDRNTTFFHISTIIRRRRNRIEMLKNDDGNWIADPTELEKLAVDYFSRLYSLTDVNQIVDGLPYDGFVQILEEDKTDMNKPFTDAEVVRAVRSMGKFKAPGPDGFQPVFYQHCWEVVGESVLRFVLEFFQTGMLPQDTNDAIVVLIPKVAKQEKITQFRPISLCNVLFKIITKTMVGRLKSVMTKLIGPAQSSFIPGRLSTDNIVVVQEA